MCDFGLRAQRPNRENQIGVKEDQIETKSGSGLRYVRFWIAGASEPTGGHLALTSDHAEGHTINYKFPALSVCT